MNKKSPKENLSQTSLREILHGAAAAFILKASGAGAALLFALVVARRFGADTSGVFFLALTLATILATVARLGMDSAIVKHVAILSDTGSWAGLRDLYRSAFPRVAIFSLGLSALLALSAGFLAQRVFHEPRLTSVLRIMALIITPHALYWLHAEVLRGLKRIALSQLVQGVAMPLCALLGALIWLDDLNLDRLTWIYTGACWLAAASGALFWWRASAGNCSKDSEAVDLNDFYQSCVPLFVISIMLLVQTWSATVTLGISSNSYDIGLFAIAQRLSLLTSFVLVAFNSISAPKFAELYRRGNLQELESTARHSAAMMLMFTMPLLLLYLLAPGPLLALFGEEFRTGSLLLSCLAVGQFVNAASGSVAYLLVMTGHEKRYQYSFGAVTLLNIVLCYFLIPWLGAIGAALTTSLTVIFLNIWSLILVKKYLNIWVLPSITGLFGRHNT